MSTFSSACEFMMGLDNRQQRAKFEVASPIRYRNIVEETQNFEELP